MKKSVLFIVVFIVILFIGEQYFKKKYRPGYQTHYKGFELVDSLIVYQDYFTDEYGNYVLSPLLTDTLKKKYDYTNCNISDVLIENKIASTDGVKRILNEFCELKNITVAKTEFETFALNILKKDTLDSADSLYLNYINYPFNNQGFRSIEFKKIETKKTKIMIIGDSFVWGMSATPYYNSFADILSARGYVVYNAGIASVDPIQYLNVAKKYVSEIQPDIVVVNFYAENDIMNGDRIHKKGIPHEHITNAGFFESNPEGIYLNAQDAYNYYSRKLEIPKDNFIDILLSKSALGSVLWTALNKNRLVNFYSKLNDVQKINITKKYIDSLSIFLEKKEFQYFYTINPNEVNNEIKYDTTKINKIFDTLAYYSPKNLKFEDYNQPKDFHFNNKGSLKYANFIDSLLQEKLNAE